MKIIINQMDSGRFPNACILKIFIPLICLIFAVSLISCSNESPLKIEVVSYGGVGLVSGSMHHVNDYGVDFFVDAGSFYDDLKNTDSASLLPPTEDIKKAKAIFITHTHIDHCGRLEDLADNGFEGDIYCTEATFEIMKIMLEMSLEIRGDYRRHWVISNKYLNGPNWKHIVHFDGCQYQERIRGGLRKDSTLEELRDGLGIDLCSDDYVRVCKVCTEKRLNALLQKIKIAEFEQEYKLEHIKFKFLKTGHLPGSASIIFNSGENRKYAFSGDLGSSMSKLQKAPEPLEKVGQLFVESTYGAYTRNIDLEEELGGFAKAINETLARNGAVIIPSFVLDRTQNVLHTIKYLMDHRMINGDVPIYVPSARAQSITHLYSNNTHWFNMEEQEDPFLLHVTDGRPENLKIDTLRGSIIIASSGMFEFSVSKALLPLLEDISTSVLFVSYQSPTTIGGAIKSGDEYIDSCGQKIRIQSKIYKFDFFSGHGDASEIDRWLINNKESQVYLIHGDLDSLESRKEDLKSKGFLNVYIPEMKRPVTLVQGAL